MNCFITYCSKFIVILICDCRFTFPSAFNTNINIKFVKIIRCFREWFAVSLETRLCVISSPFCRRQNVFPFCHPSREAPVRTFHAVVRCTVDCRLLTVKRRAAGETDIIPPPGQLLCRLTTHDGREMGFA